MKLMIFGQARSGKDFAAEFLKEKLLFKYQGSSEAAADIFIYDKLKTKYGYKNYYECFQDRMNHRQEWFELIANYNSKDILALAKGIYSTNDCYVGIRRKEELEAAKEYWEDLISIYIDSNGRTESEDSKSCTICSDQADFIIENKTTKKEYIKKLEKLSLILYPHFNKEHLKKFNPSWRV